MSKIYVVGIGPGAYDQMTGRAIRALNESDVIIGYTVYVDLVKEYFAGKEFMTTPMKKEVDRCVLAFDEAKKGKTVSMICSGDAGVYGMAGLMYEVGENYPDVEVVLNRTQDKTSDGCYIWATDMITAHPETDAIFCYWAECAMATYNALQDAGNTRTKIIGYDATEEQQETMKKDGEDGQLYASPGMSPSKMATQCIVLMEDIFADKYKRNGPEDIYEMDPVLLNVHNAEEFNINE